MLTWVEIKKQAIQHNLKQFRKLVGPRVKLMAVIKSNAYGHGIIELAKATEKEADWLGVVNLKEALELRQAGIKTPVLVLSYWPGWLRKYYFSSLRAPHLLTSEGRSNLKQKRSLELQIKRAIKQNIDLVVYDLQQAILLSKLGKKLRKKVYIHIKVDTGTSRLGILVEEALGFLKKVKEEVKNLEIRGVMTHYASSEDYDQTYTIWQTKRFEELLAKLDKVNLRPPLAHAGCSASTIVNPATHFDMVRIGISMYGLWPSKATKKLAQERLVEARLQPALSWYARIIQLKTLPKNRYVGYGCGYKTKRQTKLAVVPVGYYEGYDRKLSGKAEVLIRGKRAKVLGRVCMNLIMVDVTDIPNVRVGDKVTLIGPDGKEIITGEELAEKIKTINYEVVCRINPEISRIFK